MNKLVLRATILALATTLTAPAVPSTAVISGPEISSATGSAVNYSGDKVGEGLYFFGAGLNSAKDSWNITFQGRRDLPREVNSITLSPSANAPLTVDGLQGTEVYRRDQQSSTYRLVADAQIVQNSDGSITFSFPAQTGFDYLRLVVPLEGNANLVWDDPTKEASWYNKLNVDSVSIAEGTPSEDDLADLNAPIGQDITVKWGVEPNARDGIRNADNLPEGTTFDFKEPVPIKDSGEHDVLIVVKYRDGSEEEVETKVVVEPSMAEKITPEPLTIYVDWKQAVSANSGVKSLDEIVSVRFKDQVDTNTPTKDPKRVTLVVTYSDGSSEEVVTFMVVTDMAGRFTPVTTSIVVPWGEQANAADGITNISELPKRTIFEFVTRPNANGTYDMRVKYPDTSEEIVRVKVTFARSMADLITPTPKEIKVAWGGTPDPAEGIHPIEGATVAFKITPSTKTKGSHPVTLIVTYSDGSKDEVQTTVDVAPSLAEQNDPKAQPVARGGEAKDGIQDFASLPATKAEWSGTNIVVTYTDGSQDTVEAVFREREVVIIEGDTPKAKDVVDAPEDATVEWAESPKTTEPGAIDATVIITSPDGEKKEVPITIVVAKSPEFVDVAVPLGTKVEAEKAVANAGELPEGTVISWKDEPATDKVGTSTGTVVVTYPGGGTREEEVDVEVVGPIVAKAVSEPGALTDPRRFFGALPADAKVGWVETPSTAKGEHKAQIRVTVGGESAVFDVLVINELRADVAEPPYVEPLIPSTPDTPTPEPTPTPTPTPDPTPEPAPETTHEDLTIEVHQAQSRTVLPGNLRRGAVAVSEASDSITARVTSAGDVEIAARGNGTVQLVDAHGNTATITVTFVPAPRVPDDVVIRDAQGRDITDKFIVQDGQYVPTEEVGEYTIDKPAAPQGAKQCIAPTIGAAMAPLLLLIPAGFWAVGVREWRNTEIGAAAAGGAALIALMATLGVVAYRECEK